MLRGGFGLFYERTPSAAGAFKQYESAIDTRYGADGITPVGAAMLFQHMTDPELRTSRSLTWDLAYDHRFNPRWALHLGVIDRHGSTRAAGRADTGAATSELRLDSNGRSRYREAEFGVHFTRRHGRRSQCLLRAVAGARRDQRVHDVLRFGAVADRRRERVRAGPGRRAAPSAAARPRACRRRPGCWSA